jgi:hypothetical protein
LRGLADDRHRETLSLWIVVVILTAGLLLLTLSRFFSTRPRWPGFHIGLFALGVGSIVIAVVSAAAIYQGTLRF